MQTSNKHKRGTETEIRTTRRAHAILRHPNPFSRVGTAQILARRGGVWLQIQLWRRVAEGGGLEGEVEGWQPSWRGAVGMYCVVLQ